MNKKSWIDSGYFTGSLAGLTLMATLAGCSCGPSFPPVDERLYVSYRSGPGGNPLAVYNGGTTVTQIPVAALANQAATSVVAASINNAAPRLYATIDGNPGRLAIVNTTGNVLLANITVGNQPSAVALNADATRAYVTNLTPNPSLSVINLGNNTVTATVAMPAGSNPSRVKVDPTGDVWVLTQGVNTVTVVDGTTNAIESTIAVNQPQDIAIHPNGQQVYVANAGNTLTMIDAATRAVATSVSVPGIQSLAAAVGQDVLVVGVASTSNSNSGVIQLFDAITLAADPPAPFANPNFGGISRVAAGPITLLPATAMVGVGPSILTPQNTFVSIANTRTSDLSFIHQITQTAPTQTILTDPPGLRVRVDGTEVTTPANFTWAAGTNHTLNVTSPQSPVAGTRHLWESWSNGGALSQTVTAVSGSTTYTAKFKTQHEVKTGTIPAFTVGFTATVSPAATDNFYDAGSVVTVTAATAANSGYVFGEWRDDASGEINPVQMVVSKPSLATAFFDTIPLWTSIIGSRGPQPNDGYFHTTTWRNNRPETYTEIRINSIQFTVDQGTGAISNTTSLPILIGTLAPNATSSAFVFTGSIPATITRWNFTMTGTAKNAAGRIQQWTNSGTVQR